MSDHISRGGSNFLRTTLALIFGFLLLITLALFTAAGALACLSSGSRGDGGGEPGAVPLLQGKGGVVSTETVTPGPTSCVPAWTVLASPNPGTSQNTLYAVAVAASNDAWAVGRQSSSDGATYWTLIEHWDGTQWSVASSPNPESTDNALRSVSVVSANDIWAIGCSSCGYAFSAGLTLIEHWDGSSWSIVPSPNVGRWSNKLLGVAAAGPNDVWAVGSYSNSVISPTEVLIEHWDGTQWSVVPSPDGEWQDNALTSVSAISANDVWAVGSYTTADGNSTLSLILHWDGRQWAVIPNPDPPNIRSYPTVIAAVSASDVWIAGNYSSPSIWPSRTRVEHWDGTQWSIIPSPNAGIGASINAIQGMAAVSANDVWIVGDYWTGIASQTLAEHWDGSQWSIVPSPNVGSGTNHLFGAAVAPGGAVWMVGDTYVSNNAFIQTLAMRYKPLFTDVPPENAFYDPIRCLACQGIVSGYADGTFHPGSAVTRAQLAKMVSGAAGYTDPIPASRQTFQDVRPGSTFWLDIERLYAHEAIQGYPCGGKLEPCVPPDGLPYFRQGASASRGQVSKIVSTAAGYKDDPGAQAFEDVPSDSPFYTWINRLAMHGVISGYPCGGEGEPCVPPDNRPYFRPNANVSRGQLAKMAANTFFPNCTASLGK